jgi:hypothetical protein
LAGCIIGTNVAPPNPRRDVEWSHRNKLLYCGFIRGAVSPKWPPRIPARCLGDNNVSSVEVGSLRIAAPSVPREPGVLDRKTGGAVAKRS